MKVANREIAERSGGQVALEASTPKQQSTYTRRQRQTAGDRRAGLSLVLSIADSQPMAPRPARAPGAVPFADERRRLERDLHDGVQNELVGLIIKLAHAQEDAKTPPELMDMLAGLEARAQAALNSLRNIARGIYPSLLADLGLAEALRAQAARAPVDVRLIGTAPRSTEAAEDAVYFACSEAIQNAAKYAGGGAHVTVRLRHDEGSLAVRVADDGRGFDPARTSTGAGLGNMRDRTEGVAGTFRLDSRPGHGTVLTLTVPWPGAADGRDEPGHPPVEDASRAPCDRLAVAFPASAPATNASGAGRSAGTRRPRPTPHSLRDVNPPGGELSAFPTQPRTIEGGR